MNLSLHLTMCGVLVAAIIAVALYRKWLEDHGDHYIHLHNDSIDSRVITSQTSVAKRIDMLDKVTRYLTIAVVIYALIIAGLATYTAWIASGSV